MADNEEQKRQARLEKLSRWKQKKQQLSSQNVTDTNNIDSKPVDDKVNERLAKLAKWKKRKLETEVDSGAEKGIGTEKQEIIKVKKKNKKKRKTTNVFGDTVQVKANIPSNDDSKEVLENANGFHSDNNNDNDDNNKDDDALDNFMNDIASNVYVGNHAMQLDTLDSLENLQEDTTSLSSNNGINEEKAKLAKVKKLKSKKLLAPIRYDVSTLEPIKKMLYTEPEEMKKYTEEEITDLRLDLDNIQIEGINCPRPVTKWTQLGLPDSILNILKNDLKYESLTPIQSQTIPAIMMGHDVIGISKTGSGKTISYLLPLIRHVKAQRKLAKEESGPIALVFAPSRELALQINEELGLLLQNDSTIRTLCCTGGSEMRSQINNLKRGTEIIVATPGRFIDLLTLNGGNLVSSKRISYIVMDEADRLFDFGFEPQISSVLKTVRPDKQCVLFSATFPSKLSSFAMRFLRQALKITIDSEGLVNDRIEQYFKICADESTKFQELLNILYQHQKLSSSDEDNKLIVFVSSQQICDILDKRLSSNDIGVYSIHAGKPYNERMKNLSEFKNQKNSILLCTEVLSRGLNVPEVSKVILYNSAKTFAQYVHSTGRTARGTKTGDALTLLLPNELSSAYILSKSIPDDKKKFLNKEDVSKLEAMAGKFNEGLKTGKYKLATGLGGKGLDNLEQQRKESLSTGEDYAENSERNNLISSSDLDISIPNLKDTVIERTEGDSMSSIAFRATIIINDLPQFIRWEMTKNTTLASIISETGCSITLRGQFYPDGTAPTNEKDPPKLYLLIEASTEKDVRQCISLFEENIKIGLKKATMNTLKSTKY